MSDEDDPEWLRAFDGKRLQQILELVSQGRNNREIAQMASLTETTVKARVNTLYGKLEITRKVESVSYSVQWRESRSTS